MTNNYSDKLKDPRWQKKRLEILQRDDWTCQKCFDSESPLHIHHRRYINGIEPWDYPDEILVTLCESCHESEMMYAKESLNLLITEIQDKFFADGFHELAIGFHELIIINDSGFTASAIWWVLSNPTVFSEIMERFIHRNDK